MATRVLLFLTRSSSRSMEFWMVEFSGDARCSKANDVNTGRQENDDAGRDGAEEKITHSSDWTLWLLRRVHMPGMS